MNRPKIEDYKINDFEIKGQYVFDLEKYCDELEEKLDKYRWHDLRKDPKDLPIIQKDVLIRYLWKDGNSYYTLNGLIDEENWEIEDYASSFNYQVEIIAWKYIEEFEDE